MADLKAIADQLVGLTVKEANELADLLKDEYGIEPAGGGAVMVAGPAAGGAAEEAEEQTEFDIILKSPGGSKLAVVKLVREITGLGLKEAKGIVDGCPAPIKEKATKEESDDIANRLKEAGAEVEVK